MPHTGLSYSMVVLTYNQEAFVAEAVRAALAQQCSPIEILISDDCSCDATFKIVEETVAGYSGPHRVILNRNPKNLGLARHIDKVHELTSGVVIIAAAGDDISLPDRCQKIIDCFDLHNPMLVCSYAQVVDLNGTRATPRLDYRLATLYKSSDLLKAARSSGLYLGATGAWRRDLYDKYGPIEDGAHEDLVLGFRAALEGRVRVLHEELVVYRLCGITNKETNPKTAEDHRRQRVQHCKVMRAVLAQRRKDALTFGHAPESAVLRIINRELLRTDIIITYFAKNRAALWSMFLRHPIATLRRVLSERKRLRRNMSKLTQNNTHS
jgi:glycosyltransferase involved in cell wall biosynthesis